VTHPGMKIYTSAVPPARSSEHAPPISVRLHLLAARLGALLPPATWLGEVRTWTATKSDAAKGPPGS
jgi:hypothetical protein